MNLYKFPVFSDEGNEYAVSIEDVRFSDKDVKAVIYVKGVGWFGREKFRAVWGEGFIEDRYDAESYDYNYVKIAQAAVAKFEEAVRDANKQAAAKAKGIAKFEEWDGRKQNG
jgi:hypothetical protein